MEKREKARLVCEPVRRADGTVLEIFRDTGRGKYGFYDYVDIIIDGTGRTYQYDDVCLLGEGSFQRGINIIGQAYYKASHDEIRPGKLKLFADLIRDLKAAQGI